MSFCKQPLIIIKSNSLEHSIGKKYISWKWFPQKSNINSLILNNALDLFPCGNCLNCINMRRFHWVKKLSIEKQSWNFTYFITLTYNNENLPFELKVKDVQNFIKYYRKLTDDKFKYFCCGEYGSKFKRPHYHLILFTNRELELDFLKYTKNGILYESKLLNKCWRNKGFIWVAYDLNNMSFAYVSSYSNKSYLRKVQNERLKDFNKFKFEIINNPNIDGFLKYCLIDNEIPNILFKKNEFIIMSKKPPIGSNVNNFRDAPSSLLKWLDNNFLKQNYLESFNSLISSPFRKELTRRLDEYFIFLKNNNLYDIIRTSEMLDIKNHEKKKGIF